METDNDTLSDSPIIKNNNSELPCPSSKNNSSPSIHIPLKQNYASIISAPDTITTKIQEKRKQPHLNPQINLLFKKKTNLIISKP